MAEYIERDAVMAEMQASINAAHEDDTVQGDFIVDAFETMQDLVFAFPAADVARVVLCRDCKHKGWVQEPEHGKSVDYCRLIERCVDEQFFCAAGERKTTCGAKMEEGNK